MGKLTFWYTLHRLYMVSVLVFSVGMNPSKKLEDPSLIERVDGAIVHAANKRGERLFLFQKAKQENTDPYLWAHYVLTDWMGIDFTWGFIFLSQFFSLLFLWMLNRLLGRIVTPDVALAACYLTMVFPTGVELGLGSSFPYLCFLVVWAMFGAIDNQWWAVGIALALIGLSDPTALVVFPLLVFIFGFYQRHAMTRYIVERAAFFLVPLAAVALWQSDSFSELLPAFSRAALWDPLGQESASGMDWKAMIVAGYLALGAVVGAVSNTYFVDRLIPVYGFAMWLLYCPWDSAFDRAWMGAICFQGIGELLPKFFFRSLLFLQVSITTWLLASLG